MVRKREAYFHPEDKTEALPADRFVLLGLLEMRSILCLGAEDNRIKVLLLPYTP
jgi:hypothetical protein